MDVILLQSSVVLHVAHLCVALPTPDLNFQCNNWVVCHRVQEWLVDIAEGLQYMSTQPDLVLHRDIKKENVLLTKRADRKYAKLCDFGLSMVRLQLCMQGLHSCDSAGSACDVDMEVVHVVRCAGYREYSTRFLARCTPARPPCYQVRHPCSWQVALSLLPPLGDERVLELVHFAGLA